MTPKTTHKKSPTKAGKKTTNQTQKKTTRWGGLNNKNLRLTGKNPTTLVQTLRTKKPVPRLYTKAAHLGFKRGLRTQFRIFLFFSWRGLMIRMRRSITLGRELHIYIGPIVGGPR